MVNRRAAMALLVFVVALTAYLITLAPTMALIDSSELTDAAWSLGNAHPPGFPLFIPRFRKQSGATRWRHRAAFLTRARYLAFTRHTKEAVADDQQAMALDPENRMLEREMITVQAMAH